jgi:hypothetical protein
MQKLLYFWPYVQLCLLGNDSPGSKVYVAFPTKDDFDRYLMAEIQKRASNRIGDKTREAEFECRDFLFHQN